VVSEAQPPPDDPEARRSGFSLYVHAVSGELEFERVAFFSDAVFAIAVTLLIINVHVPPSVGTGPAAARFARGMDQELGRIISWALSFYVVARVWIGHHTLFRYLREIDARLLGLTLLFLGLVGLPAVRHRRARGLGQHRPRGRLLRRQHGRRRPGPERPLAVCPPRQADLPGPGPEMAKAYLLAILTFPAVFLVSVPVAFFSPAAAEIMWGIVALTRGLVRRRILAAFDRSGSSPA
jgi:hypothetical protein